MNKELTEQDRILDVIRKIYGYQVTQSIAIACKLDLPEYLKNPIFYKDLANTLSVDANALLRLLRFLHAEGFIEEVEQETFINTKHGSLLSTDSDVSLKHVAIMHGSNFYWTCWKNSIESIKSGRSASDYAFNKDSFTYLQDNPEEFNIFNLSMENLCSIDKKALPSLYDFSHHETIIDVGGGTGLTLFSILEHDLTFRT